MRLRVSLFGACVLGLVSIPAFAAEFTDLADAADDKDDLVEETFDPFDFSLEPTFRADFGSATITREATCVPSENDLQGTAANDFNDVSPRLTVDSQRCAEPQIVDNKEADYSFTRLTLDVALKAGLYKDLEFHLHIPFVLSEANRYTFADGVDGTNSSINPADDRIQTDAERAFSGNTSVLGKLDQFSSYRFFDLGSNDREFNRGGFGDPKVGLHWAPFNDERDDTKATLLIGMDYVMPIAPIKRRGNEAVGRGLHELQWKVASSKKFKWIEPYFGLQYFLPLSASDSEIRAIDGGNEGQVFTAAPQRGEITVGTEFVPYENLDRGERYAIDLQFQFGYTSEGRDYSPLFDMLTNSECNGKTLGELLPTIDDNGDLVDANNVECAWIARQPSNAPLRGGEPNPVYDLNTADSDTEFNFDGIMTTESYGSFAGKVGFTLQPSKYFQFRANVALKHHQSHFLTNSRTGKDVADSREDTADNTVDLTGPDAAIERNPVFNPSYDGSGDRFRVEGFNTWTVNLTAAFKF